MLSKSLVKFDRVFYRPILFFRGVVKLFKNWANFDNFH